MAVPVIPNFSQGVVSSHTESKTIVKESIVSESYRSGFEYTVSGTGVEPTSGIVSPSISGNKINLSSRSTWKQSVPGAAFQFVETLNTPGLIEKVIIDRETITETVIDSTSTFSQRERQPLHCCSACSTPLQLQHKSVQLHLPSQIAVVQSLIRLSRSLRGST